MCTLQVVNQQSVRSVICGGFMTNHTINVFNRQNTTILTQLEAKIMNQTASNGLMFSSATIIWLHFCHLFLPRCMQCRRGLAMRFLSVRPSVRLSVCPSVRLSVKRVHCDKTEEKSVQIFISYERTFILEWLVGATPSTWNFGSTGPRWSEIADFEPIIARSASAVRPSKKVQLTLIESPLFAFQRT